MRKVVPRSPACQVVSEPFEPVAFDVNGYQGAFPDKSFCKLRRRRKCENGQSAVTLPCLPVSFQHRTCAQVGNKYGLTSALIGQKSESEPSSNLCGDVSIFIPDLGIILPAYYRRYKVASSVNLYRFTYLRRFPQRRNLRKLLVGEASPIPFERHLRCQLRIHSEYFYLLTSAQFT